MRMWDFFCTFAPKLEKYTLMKKIFVILSACLMSVAAWAVMATPEPIEFTQADGSTVTLKIVGDEFHHYYTRLDGTPVRLNEQGMWIEDASVVSAPTTSLHARRAAQAQLFSGGFPLSGSPKSVVILVNFKDIQFKYAREDFDKMLNTSGYKENGGIGSARDYFIACSDSVFSPLFDCYGPVTLSRNCDYYGGNTGGSTSAHAAQMVVEACHLVKEQYGIDFTQYDTNDDGRIDNVFIYYAGYNEAEGGAAGTIWPHRSIVSGAEQIDGKTIYDYACTSELRGRSGSSMCGIGTFCHEFGHVLGLPDYYDTERDQYTIGTWDIMCSGSYNGNGKTPPSYTAGERFQLGWSQPIQLEDAGFYTLQPVESTNQLYLIAKTKHNLSWGSADPNEYWLLENRQHVGWDQTESCLPATGMLIWHIAYSAGAWNSNTPNNNTPLRYDLEEAGGVKGYAAASDPFPGAKKVTTFTPTLHNGEIIEQPLMSIAEEEQKITFMFKSSDFMFLPTDFPVLKSTYNTDAKSNKAYTPAELMKIVGEHLNPEVPVSIAVSGKGFVLSKDSLTWTTAMPVTVNADSTLDIDVYVHYAPGKQVCDVQRGTVTASQGSKVGSFAVYGTSPRPTLITPPYVSAINEVTPTSFKIHWDPVEDAQFYYLTLYHMEEGEESVMESFEGWDDENVVLETGWYTSFYRTTTKAKEDGAVSMWFKENNEAIISPIYPQPVVGLSIWLNAPATTDTEVGFFTLIGYSETGIDTLEEINVSKSTKKYTYSRTFEASQNYRRFQLVYTSLGGEGVCMDAFTTTFNHKTVYTYKGREKTIEVMEGDEAGEYTNYYAFDLIPNTTYYVQLQCSENKGCEEHVSQLSQLLPITTKQGEGADSKHLTLDYDSIYYDPATHVVYIPNAEYGGSINIYTTEGELVKTIHVEPTQNVVALPDNELSRATVYIVKYLPSNKMKRKDPWIKILFR